MSKSKVKLVEEKVVNSGVDEIDAIFEELLESGDMKIVETKEVKEKKSKSKSKEPVSKSVDIESLFTELPQVVDSKAICTVLNMDDGGKRLRRTLRAKFAELVSHDHKSKWVFDKKLHVDTIKEILTLMSWGRNPSPKGELLWNQYQQL